MWWVDRSWPVTRQYYMTDTIHCLFCFRVIINTSVLMSILTPCFLHTWFIGCKPVLVMDIYRCNIAYFTWNNNQPIILSSPNIYFIVSLYFVIQEFNSNQNIIVSFQNVKKSTFKITGLILFFIKGALSAKS